MLPRTSGIQNELGAAGVQLDGKQGRSMQVVQSTPKPFLKLFLEHTAKCMNILSIPGWMAVLLHSHVYCKLFRCNLLSAYDHLAKQLSQLLKYASTEL